ncbi:Hypothetical_protein [Hexamita inflata]|uniref:Hypothetical_protein n=1 Tax=Hexamita inflata TaxID=28002 RepID=A0AA86Q4G9_9EUKA|nr:Hypothetical protein HINF_LOCUS38021 [Hexamita inflata]
MWELIYRRLNLWLIWLNQMYVTVRLQIQGRCNIYKNYKGYIGFNLVTYIKPLQYLYELKYVNFYGNYIVDFSELRNHENYNYYHIGGQQEPTQSQLNQVNQLQYMDNAADYIDYIEQQSHWVLQRIVKLKSQRQQFNSILMLLNHHKISFSEQITSLFQYILVAQLQRLPVNYILFFNRQIFRQLYSGVGSKQHWLFTM